MRTRRSREQWTAVLEEFEGSGEPVESFCRRRGLRRSTLYWWKWKLGSDPRRSRPSAAIRLLPVAVSPGAGAPGIVRRVLIEVADVRLHVEVGTDVAYLSALVATFRQRC